MTAEERRMFREAAQVLLMLMRCISMKRALAVSDADHLNFFRLYDSCLMDSAVLAWCKLFGSIKSEDLHWQKLFPDSAATFSSLKQELELAAGGDLQGLSVKIRNYRDKFVAHYDLNESKRASRYPDLGPLQETGQIMYTAVYGALSQCGSANDLSIPDAINGENLAKILKNWESIGAAARSATANFRD